MLCVGGGERHSMKLKDKEIEKERERERELERETTQDNPTTEIIEHFTHPHRLISLDADYNQFVCNACKCSGRGKRYHCAQCNFDLHKICAESPITWLLHQMPPEEIERFGILQDIIETFAHPHHSVIAEYKQQPFTCGHCKNVGNGLRYFCDACNVMFHQVCAKNPTRLTSHLHPQHELELKLSTRGGNCGQCKTKGKTKNNWMYTCKVCEFYMHPGCSQLPLYLLHPLHPPHPLLLKRSCSDYCCSACSNWRTNEFKYSCTRCGLDFDRTCIMGKSILGLGDEVRQNYTEHMITILPVANLTSSYPSKRDPVMANNDNNLHMLPISILEIVSEM